MVLAIFFRCTLFSIVDSLAIVLLNITIHVPTSFSTLSPTCLALVTSPPFLQSIAHYTRLVIPWQVLHIALPYLLQSIKSTWNHLRAFTLVNMFQPSRNSDIHRLRKFEKDSVWNKVDGRALNTLCLCRQSSKRQRGQVKRENPYRTQSSLSSGISTPSLKFGPRNRDDSHGDGFK
jgi:hypothetical protein